jgi:hypothetical protein
MQWASKQFAFAAEAPKVPLSTAPSSPSFMKFARLTAPFSADATTFMISKMKEDGFNGVLFSVSQEDWRLHRNIIVSVFYFLSSPFVALALDPCSHACCMQTEPNVSVILSLPPTDPLPHRRALPFWHVRTSFTGTHGHIKPSSFAQRVDLLQKLTQCLSHARVSRAAILDLLHADAAGKQLSFIRLLSKSAREASFMHHTLLSSQSARCSHKHTILSCVERGHTLMIRLI